MLLCLGKCSLFIRNPDSQSQCTLLLFVELELVDQGLAFRQLVLYCVLRLLDLVLLQLTTRYKLYHCSVAHRLHWHT